MLDAVEVSVTGFILVSLAAVAVFGLYFLWKHPLDIAALTRMDAQAALAPKALGSPKVTDFGWVTRAMDACDKDAVNDKDGLYFLIIPLARSDKDDPEWGPKAIGTASNASLIPTKDAVEGLKSGVLKVYPGEYLFRVLDKSTGNAFRWNAANGVAKFSRAGAKSVDAFRIGFQTLNDKTDDGEASEFRRFEGTCHWVSAIMTR